MIAGGWHGAIDGPWYRLDRTTDEANMAQLIVRNLDDAVKHKLQRRAARHGRSMEEEIRDILRDAVKDEGRARKGLGTEIADLFRGVGLDEPIQELCGYPAQPAKLDE
jgi:antitoxin FitA